MIEPSVDFPPNGGFVLGSVDTTRKDEIMRITLKDIENVDFLDVYLYEKVHCIRHLLGYPSKETSFSFGSSDKNNARIDLTIGLFTVRMGRKISVQSIKIDKNEDIGVIRNKVSVFLKAFKNDLKSTSYDLVMAKKIFPDR